MKRLIDETSDDLTHSLLQAGIDHRPPVGNQAHLLVALGAGSALGLTTSKALGFWGTSAGKLTLVGLSAAGVGLAGAFYTATAEPDAQHATSALHAAPAKTVAAAPAPLAPSEPPARDVPSPAEHAGPVIGTTPAQPEAAGTAEREQRPARQTPAARPRRQAERQSPVEPRGGADETSPPPDESAAAQVPSWGLDTEVEWVDAMRSAVRQGDRANLARLLERYRATFPEGQLRQEVAELSNRL